MAISSRQMRLGDFASQQAALAASAFPGSFSPEVGLTSNAYGMVDPVTGQARPYTAADIIAQGGGDPNSIINVPYGQDFMSQWGWTLPMLGAAGAALAAPAAGGTAAASGAGAGATDLAATDLAGVGAGGMAAGGLTGGAATAGAGTVGGVMAADTVPSFDQILANAGGGSTLSTAGSPADYFSAGGITTGNTALDASLSGLGGSSLFGSLGNVGSGLSNLSSNPALQQIFSGLGGVGGAAGSLLPGMLALNYARGMTGPDLTNLNTIQSWLMNNQGPVVQAATDPLRQAQAGGYGDLLQSQAARGIRGSSFGDTDIANYLNTTGRGIADAGTNALLGSLGTAANVGSNIANLQNITQQQKLDLYGRAVDAFGRALNPSGYAGTMNFGGGTNPYASTAGSTGSSVGALGQLVGGLGSLGSGLYSLFG